MPLEREQAEIIADLRAQLAAVTAERDTLLANRNIAVALGDNLYVYGNQPATELVQSLLQRLAIAESSIYNA